MHILTNDALPEADESRDSPTLRRLADLLCIEMATFFDGRMPPAVHEDNVVVYLNRKSDLQAALSNIEDDKVRAYMAQLIESLETLKVGL